MGSVHGFWYAAGHVAMKVFQMRWAGMDLSTLRRTALTAAVVAAVETPIAMAIGAALGYTVGPRQQAAITIDTADLPVGTTIRVEEDRVLVLPARSRVWRATTAYHLKYDGRRWLEE